MTGDPIDQPNPPSEPSGLPDFIAKLKVSPDKTTTVLSDDEKKSLQSFRRAANFLAAAMIFLNDNVMLERKISRDDIKPRLLGHWGTCPGLTLVYAHSNYLIQRTPDRRFLSVIGPGHGAPGILAALWLEGSLGHFYPEYSRDKAGMQNLITKFSTAGGLPSHINAETPGAIHEGGELGYALSVSFGAVMDKPDLVAVCVVGDGEAETGPTATAWHGYKYIDPAESGAVLPIVHVNGFKISQRTVYGTMDDDELLCLFTGYGYQVRIVEDLDNIDQDLASAMSWAISEIKHIQSAARSGKPITKPRWPVIILRTPKGWSGPKKQGDQIIEGSFHAHQVPLPKAADDDDQLATLDSWLRSYKISELFDKSTGVPTEEVLKCIPKDDSRKMGQISEAHAGHDGLKVPDWRKWATEVKDSEQQSCMTKAGQLLSDTIKENPTTFRIFSPDELTSNKLDAVFETTGRNFQWDQYSKNEGGRVIEILSEHTCQGMMQGYTLTGRSAVFPSYESFLGIIHTMIVQYSKFNKIGDEIKWRNKLGSVNYIETSTWARQEHNGFSHQNPSFIGAVLNLKPQVSRVYLPPDANCFLSTLAHSLRSKNYVNLLVGSKQPSPIWLSPEEADRHCIAGASIWRFASTDGGENPDVVLVGIGVEVNFEVIAAASLLRKEIPELLVRVVNVTDLMVLGPGHPNSLGKEDFESLFTSDRPVVFNYHGYTQDLRGLLFGRIDANRTVIEGYKEEGSTTTPFDMMLRNDVSRYHVACHAVRSGGKFNPKVSVRQHELVAHFLHQVTDAQKHILATGEDPEGTYDIPHFQNPKTI